MRRVRRVARMAARAALRAYASDTACELGLRLAMILVVSLGLLALSYQCVPAPSGDSNGAAALCWEMDPMCPPPTPAPVLDQRP